MKNFPPMRFVFHARDEKTHKFFSESLSDFLLVTLANYRWGKLCSPTPTTTGRVETGAAPESGCCLDNRKLPILSFVAGGWSDWIYLVLKPCALCSGADFAPRAQRTLKTVSYFKNTLSTCKQLFAASLKCKGLQSVLRGSPRTQQSCSCWILQDEVRSKQDGRLRIHNFFLIFKVQPADLQASYRIGEKISIRQLCVAAAGRRKQPWSFLQPLDFENECIFSIIS